MADFCPICLDLRRFKLFRHGKTGHVYGVKVGTVQSAGDFVSCESCGVFYPVDSTKFKGPCGVMELEETIRASFPNIHEHHADRLDCEVRIRDQRLNDEQRRFLLMEPFRFLDFTILSRAQGKLQMDRVTSMGCVGTLLVCVMLAIVSAQLDNSTLFPYFFCAATAAVGVAFLIARAEPRRHARKTLQPVIARVLSRLKPTESELKRTLSQLRSEGVYAGKCFSARGIIAEMAKSSAAPNFEDTPNSRG